MGRILFVEDDADDIFLIQRACRDAGIENPKEFAQNGKAALELLTAASDSAEPSLRRLIFADLNMPVMGGIEFIRSLRKEPLLQHIPVVVLTTSEKPQDLAAAYRAGANAYLVKPSGMTEFAEMLGCATNFWLRYNRSAPA